MLTITPRRRPWLRRLLAAAGTTLALAASPLAAWAAAPVEAYFKPAKVQAADLSPSGRWLAALTSVPGRRTGFLMVDTQGGAAKFIEASPTEDISWFWWVNDEWLVFGIKEPGDRSNRPTGSGLMAMKRDGSKLRRLISPTWEKADPLLRRNVLDPSRITLIGRGLPGSDEIIVGERQYDVNNEYSHTLPMALNVTDTSLRSLAKDAPKATRWVFDGQRQPRVAINGLGAETTVYWAEKPGGPWREISRAPAFEQPFLVAYVDGVDTLVVSRETEAAGLTLRRFDFATGKPEAKPFLETPGYNDLPDTIRDRATGRVLGLNLDLEARTTIWFSEEMKRLQAQVDAKLPGRVNRLGCSPCVNPSTVLVDSYSDTFAGEVLLWQPKTDQWQRVDLVRPDLEGSPGAPLDLHRTTARDGRELPVWVTLPQQPAGKALPAVVLVHGGPHVRGTIWGFDSEAQFLASRGYVVIQPEFRGSSGYGVDHEKAGYKQWGLAMQDDISDALKFAVAKGWADPKRACIVGASYGGYAALMGLVKDPGQYRCAVATMAVTDPRNMFDMHWSDISTASRETRLPVTLGDRKADEARFIATSPVEQAAKISAPVLLMHGANDRRVPIQNGERMRDALRKLGKPVEWVVYPDEGHGFAREENEFDYWRRIETFLGTHLK